MHVVPPPMIGIYMPSKSDFGIDESKFIYGPKQSKTSESDAKTSDLTLVKPILLMLLDKILYLKFQQQQLIPARKANTARPMNDPQKALKNKGIIDSGCSRQMTGNKAYLVEYQKLYGSQLTVLYSKELANPKQRLMLKTLHNPFDS
ncbi:hypothetical protein Tco_0355284 [Tanacetum coccineum]